MLRNESGLIPQIPTGGPLLKLDFPGLRIGIAEYDEGPTGCTVLSFPKGAASAVDVRGGSPGLIGGYERVDAVCFAGGSLYGLEAATGVASEILAVRNTAIWGSIARVSGAIIYDFGSRSNLIYPDKTLGRAAFLAAKEGSFPLGQRGAGRSASVGKIRASDRFDREPGGQGGAFYAIGNIKFAVLTVVNAMGVVLNEDGTVLRGFVDRQTGQRMNLRQVMTEHPKELEIATGQGGGNTTVSAVVVNLQLSQRELSQLARQVHAAMATVIQPFHTVDDGDILFALSTERIDAATYDLMALGHVCSELACKAVRTAVCPEIDGS
jgi:L-aminopeptidase/D-esterase-like protein